MTDPVFTFIDDLENQITTEKKILGPVYCLGSSEISDVPEPAEQMRDPVYFPEAGWIDRSGLTTSRWCE